MAALARKNRRYAARTFTGQDLESDGRQPADEILQRHRAIHAALPDHQNDRDD